MKGLSGKQSEILDILERGGVWRASEIADELDIEASSVRRIIRQLRRKFTEGDEGVLRYIFTSKHGYTIEECAEHTVYESRMRMKIGFGVLVNGIHVFTRCKRLTNKDFKHLLVEYKPKMMNVGSMIK